MLIDRIKQAEGFSGMPYNDPLGLPTIGYGTLLPITEYEAELLLRHRLSLVRQELQEKVPFWSDLPDTIKDVLLDMAYNMGVPRLFTFKKMWEAVEKGDWNKMADEMVDSLWYSQVGSRSVLLVKMVKDYARGD